MKNVFLFHLKSSFCSQEIWVFVLTFLVIYKNGLIRKIILILKFEFELIGFERFLDFIYLFIFLIGIHSTQGLTASTRHGITEKESQKN